MPLLAVAVAIPLDPSLSSERSWSDAQNQKNAGLIILQSHGQYAIGGASAACTTARKGVAQIRGVRRLPFPTERREQLLAGDQQVQLISGLGNMGKIGYNTSKKD